jgi:hypothetical protein
MHDDFFITEKSWKQMYEIYREQLKKTIKMIRNEYEFNKHNK